MKRQAVVFCTLCLILLCASCHRAADPLPGPTPTPSTHTRSIMPTAAPPTAPPVTVEPTSAPTALPSGIATPHGPSEPVIDPDVELLDAARGCLEAETQAGTFGENTIDLDRLWLGYDWDGGFNAFGKGTAAGVPTAWEFELIWERGAKCELGRWNTRLLYEELDHQPGWIPWSGSGTYGPWDLSCFGEPSADSVFEENRSTVKYQDFALLFVGNVLEGDGAECQLANVTVTAPGYPTVRGIEVGDAWADVDRLFPTSVRREPGDELGAYVAGEEATGAVVFVFDDADTVTEIVYIYPIN